MINIGILFFGVAFGGIGALRERTIMDYSLYEQEFIGRFTEDLVIQSDKYEYQITSKRLGLGAKAVVYEAIQRPKGGSSSGDAVANRVALKCMFPSILKESELEHFKGLEGKYLEPELSIAEEFKSEPFILATLDHFVDGDFECAAFEVGGQSLEEYIKEESSLEFCRAVNIGLQMVNALAVLHEANVTHGNFNRGNILLGTATDPTANVKVVGFGGARKLSEPNRWLLMKDVTDLKWLLIALLEKSVSRVKSRAAFLSLSQIPEGVDRVNEAMTRIRDSNCPAEATAAAESGL